MPRRRGVGDAIAQKVERLPKYDLRRGLLTASYGAIAVGESMQPARCAPVATGAVQARVGCSCVPLKRAHPACVQPQGRAQTSH